MYKCIVFTLPPCRRPPGKAADKRKRQEEAEAAEAAKKKMKVSADSEASDEVTPDYQPGCKGCL